MIKSLRPDIKFILHGRFKNTNNETKDWRPIAVASTLKDFLRRKELNRKVSVETIPCKGKDGLDVLVLPGKVRYTNIVPENVPDMVVRHVDRLKSNRTASKQLDEEGERYTVVTRDTPSTSTASHPARPETPPAD